MHCKLTLISAPAGFGKTTLISEWLRQCQTPAAWLSLDEGDNDPIRFLTYLVAALQTVAANIGKEVLALLQSTQPPPVESILTTLLNDITTISDNFILVLDDYHVIDSQPVNQTLAFLVEHLPPHLHLVIATREDPSFPLARLRARGQLIELRAADLRFSSDEAVEFLNRVMGLNLSPEDIAALGTRTEGWIAGLQLAAISLMGHQDTTSFIQSFSGSHRFVMDYLVEEVLRQQPVSILKFLLNTSILDRLCGSLCDEVLLNPPGSGQETLEFLEQSNLFIVPLDNERRWYRYHHLFADLLRQRLNQGNALSADDQENHIKQLHIRASQWYEENGLQIEAFRHAAAANDIDRAERLIDAKGMPFHFSGGVAPILAWLESLPTDALNTRPSLWWRHAALLLIAGRTDGVEEKLNNAEAALSVIQQGAEPDDMARNLIGQIATARATLALTRYDFNSMLDQSRRALAYLSSKSLFSRANAHWTLGYAYIFQGDRTKARQALLESISLSKQSGAVFTLILASIGLGNVQEADNQLYQAAETYRSVLQFAGEHPQQIIHEAHLGMARIYYEWNELDAAEQHAQQSLQLARQYDIQVIDRFILCEVFLARLKLAKGDLAGSEEILAEVNKMAQRSSFSLRLSEIAAERVRLLLRQGNLAAAENLANTFDLPLSQARVVLAKDDLAAALFLLEGFIQQVEAKGWQDERLKGLVLYALTLYLNKETDRAVQILSNALILGESGGFVRVFVDEGQPLALLISEAAKRGIEPDYTGRLLSAFEAESHRSYRQSSLAPTQIPVEPSPPNSAAPLKESLSQRELEVLRLIAQGFSNKAISQQLFLAIDTVKGCNRRIFDKLQVGSRTEAVARARELHLF